MSQIASKIKNVNELVIAGRQWTDPTFPNALTSQQLEFVNEFFSFDVDIYSQRIVFHYFGGQVPGSPSANINDILTESSRLFGRSFWRMQDSGNHRLRLVKILTTDAISAPCHIVIHDVTFDDLILATMEVTFPR